MKKRILIVDDDVVLLTGLVGVLSKEGFNVFSATNSEDALFKYKQEHPDLILLDRTLSEKDGLEVCKEIRKTDQQTIILMLTAKAKEVDKVIGLEIGADDYIVKPFSMDELIARIKAAFRRAQVPQKKIDNTPIVFSNITINPKTLKGIKGKKEFHLTSREVHLLKLFSQHEGEVLSREMLLEEVWGISYMGTTRTLDQHIVKLRQKIEDTPSQPQYILTVHGEGYRFNSKKKT